MQKIALFIVLLTALSFSISADLASTVSSSGQTQSNLILRSHSTTPMLISLNGQLTYLLIRDRSGLLINYTSSFENGKTTIRTTIPSDYLELDFDSDSFTSKNGSRWSYNLEFGSNANISYFSSKLLLPKNSTLYYSNGAVSQGSDSLMLEWVVTNITSQNLVSMKSSYQSSDDSDGIAGDLTYYLIAVVILAILGGLIYYYKRKPQTVIQVFPSEKTSEVHVAPTNNSIEENSVFKTLDQTDKQIVLYIHSKGRSTTQADLNLNTHIPKATLSRRVASLEGRGILQKTQKGIRNLVSLSDMIK